MQLINESDRGAFFADVAAASKKAVWCALATVHEGEPRVRIVHPTWDGEVLWLATATGSAKHRHVNRQPVVDIQFQVAPPEFVHVLVRGHARAIDDLTEKRRVWDVIDYDLSMFWKNGPEDPGFTAIRIDPSRVEHSLLFGSMKKRVWHRG